MEIGAGPNARILPSTEKKGRDIVTACKFMNRTLCLGLILGSLVVLVALTASPSDTAIGKNGNNRGQHQNKK